MRLQITFFAAAVAIFAGLYLSNATSVSATAGLPQTQQIFRCTVKDPTGTLLNVRSLPGGKRIVAKLKNGTRVWIENFSGDAKDQSWAEVKMSPKRGSKALGWVLQDFLDCED